MVSSNGWTAGVVHHGPPARERHATPQHRMTLTRTEVITLLDHYVTAEDAFAERVRRLREAGDPYETEGLTIRYRDRDTNITLTYENLDNET